MSTSVDPNPKQDELSSQSSQAMPATNKLTIDEIKSWKRNHLFDWIQLNLTKPLDDDEKELFLKAKVNGQAFLGLAGDVDFFEKHIHLVLGVAKNLAQLAKNLVELVKDDSKQAASMTTVTETPSGLEINCQKIDESDKWLGQFVTYCKRY
jgi:hypothetical protein